MKKYLKGLIITALLLVGCSGKKPEPTADTSNGPVVPQNTATPEEKELAMIQQCIADYNEGDLEEIEADLLTQIPDLPIGIDRLPEIQSLDDLTEIPIDPVLTNTSYKGSYKISDDITAVFEIYHPTGGIFWVNGQITFEVDPEKITRNDPQYAVYKSALDRLLTEQNNVVNWLYGLDITLSEREVADRYYEVISIGGRNIKSIEDLKEYAESVIRKQFLEEHYYPGAFGGDYPIYKEINGTLCALQSDVFGNPRTLNTSTIFAAEETPNYIRVELLQDIMGKTQPEIHEAHLIRNGDSYLLYEPA